MVQLQLSSALDKGRKHDHKVVCFQRTSVGRYVGTMQRTEDGYMGHLLSPKHPLLPAPNDGRLGFLHSNHDEAYEVLAMHVAKAAWNGSLGFEATCLDNCSRATQDSFVQWLIGQICEARASSTIAPSTDGALRREAARRIKAGVEQERVDLIARQFMGSHKAPARQQ